MHRLLMSRFAFVFAVLMSGAMVMSTWAAPASQALEPAQQAALPARVNLIHAAPFAAFDAYAPVATTAATITATRDGQTFVLAKGVSFQGQSGYLSLPAGTYEVKIFAGDLSLEATAAATPVFSANLPLAAGKDYTVVATGGANGYAINALVLDDSFTAPAAGSGLVRVVHAAPFDADRTATTVQLREATLGLLPGVLAFEQFSPFLTLPVGTYSLSVETVANQQPIPGLANLPLAVTAGSVATVIAVGGANDWAPSVIVVPFAPRSDVPPPPARVRFVHAAPFDDGTAPATVAITPLVGSDPVTATLEFGESSGYLSLAQGFYSVDLYGGTTVSGAPVVSTTLSLATGSRATVFILGKGSPEYPFNFFTLDDSLPRVMNNQALVRIVHAAPFAPSAAGTGVSITVGAPPPLVPNLLYRNSTGYVVVPTNTDIPVEVRTTTFAPGTLVFDPVPVINRQARTATTYVAIGDRVTSPTPAQEGPNQAIRLIVLNDTFTQLFMPLVVR